MVACSPDRADDDFDVLTQCVQEAKKPIARKAAKPAPHEGGDFGLVYAKDRGRPRLRELSGGNNIDDSLNQLCLGQQVFGLGKSQVSENITTAWFYRDFLYCRSSCSLVPYSIPHSVPPLL
jgi:hypothetical protein